MTLDPSVALSMLTLMLDRDYNGARQRVLKSAELLVTALASAMDTLRLQLHQLQASKSSVNPVPVKLAISALVLYCKIHIHAALSACGENEAFMLPTPITAAIQWFNRNFAPVLSDTQDQTTDEAELELHASAADTEPASPPRRRQRKRASSKHTPTHDGTKSASATANEVMSFTWQIAATVTAIACECASLGATDECILRLAHNCAVSVSMADESASPRSKRTEVTACCQHVCKLLSEVATRCNERSAKQINEVLRMILQNKITAGSRSNVQIVLVKCMTGTGNEFFISTFAKALAQDLLQCSDASEHQASDAQQGRLQILQDSLMIVLKRQPERVKSVAYLVQQQANLSSCLAENVTQAQRLDGVRVAMSTVLLVNCVMASSPGSSFRKQILPALARLLQQLGSMQSEDSNEDDDDDELSDWIDRLQDALKLVIDS